MIIDPGRDFFVEDHEVVGRSTLPAEYNDDYWDNLRVALFPYDLSFKVSRVLQGSPSLLPRWARSRR